MNLAPLENIMLTPALANSFFDNSSKKNQVPNPRLGVIQLPDSRDRAALDCLRSNPHIRQILAILMGGHNRHVTGELADLQLKANVKATAAGTFPSAMILSCLDSRVAAENVFDQDDGDVFAGQIAGYIHHPDLPGSFEFASKHTGPVTILKSFVRPDQSDHEHAGAFMD